MPTLVKKICSTQEIKLKIGRHFDKNEAENRSPKILMLREWQQTFHCYLLDECAFFSLCVCVLTLHNNTNIRCSTTGIVSSYIRYGFAFVEKL